MPRVLLAHAKLWPNVARLSIAFAKAGFEVEALAMPSHPIHRMRSPSRTYVYRSRQPLISLEDAIKSSNPSLIVPCDDQLTAHLRTLHAQYSKRRDGSAISGLIERSIGPPSSFPYQKHRGLITKLSNLPGVCIANTGMVESLNQIYEWADSNALPAFLKLDESWGGAGVVFVKTRADIFAAYCKIKFRQSLFSRLRTAVTTHEWEPVFAGFGAKRQAVTVQSYIPGSLANCAIACRDGEVLASIAVKVVEANPGFGSATVVRIVDGRDMVTAATSIAKYLKISGLYGFDFVLKEGTEQAHLIEINPRATQINHLPNSSGNDLPTAMLRDLMGRPVTPAASNSIPGEIALFPGEWLRSPNSRYLSSAHHDLPREEPSLVDYYGYRENSDMTSSKALFDMLPEKKS